MLQIYPVGMVKLAKAPNDGKVIKGKDGAEYSKHGAFCLETQKYPDAVNHVKCYYIYLLIEKTI